VRTSGFSACSRDYKLFSLIHQAEFYDLTDQQRTSIPSFALLSQEILKLHGSFRLIVTIFDDDRRIDRQSLIFHGANGDGT
jgi:hypothetical protein